MLATATIDDADPATTAEYEEEEGEIQMPHEAEEEASGGVGEDGIWEEDGRDVVGSAGVADGDTASEGNAWGRGVQQEEGDEAAGGARSLQLNRYKVKRKAFVTQEEQRKARQEAQRRAQRGAMRAQPNDAAALHQATVRREAAQRIPEFGPARDKLYVERATEIREAMAENLRRSGWLGEYVPMQMHCPLLGRRVSWQAVSEFAALAWRCDGLGFAWDCLYQPQPQPAAADA